MTSAEKHELDIARKLLVEWEQNATDAAKKELSKTLPHGTVITEFSPTPTSLLGRTRTFLGKGNEQENKEG